MTRKDYIVIADLFVEAISTRHAPYNHIIAKVAEDFCIGLANNNAKFDKVKFMQYIEEKLW